MKKDWSCFMFNLGMRLSERGQCSVCSFVPSPDSPLEDLGPLAVASACGVCLPVEDGDMYLPRLCPATV